MIRPSSLALAALLLLTGCAGAPNPSATPAALPSTSTSTLTSGPAASPSSPSSPSVTTPADEQQALTYFIVETTRGFRLVREPRQVPAATPARGALEAMVAGPADPDYRSPWPKATRILGISYGEHLIKVDVSREARQASVGAALETSMVHQLVWTVTEALDPAASVLLTIEGEPASWGHQVWDKPVPRGEAMDERLLVGIDSPAQGQTMASPAQFSGEANVFEATLLWKVKRADGSTVSNGHTSTTEGQIFAPWKLTLTLPPGSYVLEVSETDPSGGGSARPADTDTRSFTIG